jgi:putative membrane protein
MPALLSAVPAAILQAAPAAAAAQPAPLWRLMLDAALFGLSGIVLLIIGYYLWELITPYNLRREIHENRNIAVAIVVAAFILGMAIVIAASLILIK